MTKFSSRLKTVMDERGINKNTLSKETGISVRMIQSWLDNKTIPNIVKFEIIARFFNKSTDYLLGLKD